MSVIRQTNFLGGELAPLMWGRNDLPMFSRGLRTMRNFFASRPHGSAMSRPGTTYIGTTRDENNGRHVRLLPFIESDDTSYCLEVGGFSDGATPMMYIRFLADGAPVMVSYLDVTATTPFTAGALLVAPGSGAEATIVAINISPGGATRLQLAAVTGTFLNVEAIHDTSGNGGAGVVASALYQDPLEVQVEIGSDFDFLKIKYAQVGDVLTMANPASVPLELKHLADVAGEPSWTLTPCLFASTVPYFDATATGRGRYPVFDSLHLEAKVFDATHPEREWLWIVTQTVQDTATGRYYETAGWAVVQQWAGVDGTDPGAISSDLWAIYPDQHVRIWRQNGAAQHNETTTPTINYTFREVCWNVYRGRGQLYGLLGTSQGDIFLDHGEEPDYSVQPPLGNNPFAITDRNGTVVTEHPAAIGFFQDKRFFLATESRPITLFGSATGDYTNYDEHPLLPVAGEALLFELAARRHERGIHLVPHQKLLIGTRSSWWSFDGAQGPLDFDNVEARVIDEVGTTEVTPIIVEGRVVYARAKGTGVRGLLFDGNYGTYSGIDLSGHASHLFVGDTRVSTIPSTRRTKEIVDWAYAEDPFGIVWAVRDDGVLLSLTLQGESAGWAHHDGETTTGSDGYPPFYRRVCSIPEGDEDGVYVLVARSINGSGNPGKTCIERMNSRLRRGTAEDDAAVDCCVRWEDTPSLTIGGLDHLNGESVWVVGVGNAPVGPLLVSRVNIGTVMAPSYDYQLTLPELPIPNNGGADGDDGPHTGGTVVLFIGFKFTCDLETLDVQATEAKLRQKSVIQVGFEVEQTVGVEAGTDFDNLLETRPNTVATGYDPPVPTTELLEVTTERGWGLEGRAVLRQTLPLPVTVAGLIRKLDVGGP